MPIESLPNDTFTRDNLLVGFPVVSFERLLSSGGYAPAVDLGILEGAAFAREVDTLTLNKGDTGFQTVNREIVSRVAPSLNVTTYNLNAAIAELVFGSTDGVAVVAAAAQAVTDEAVTIPTASTTLLAESTMVPLAHGEIDKTAANLALDCAPIVDELVGIGDGVLGTTDGDFTLAFKPLVLGDITRLEEINPTTGAVVRAFVPQAGEPASELQAQVAVGATATSGEIDLFQAIGSGNELRADYTPSHTLEVDENAASPDMLLDPLLGRIRFPNLDGSADALRQGQGVLLDYQYNRRASTQLLPYTRPSVSGKATIRLLTSIGVNFRWDIPNVSVLITSDDLTFGVEDFATASLSMGINDNSGAAPFGTLYWSSETEANS